jgi:hypothetical protein
MAKTLKVSFPDKNEIRVKLPCQFCIRFGVKTFRDCLKTPVMLCQIAKSGKFTRNFPVYRLGFGNPSQQNRVIKQSLRV